MLISLDYSNTFPTTGRTFSETVHFQKGFGTITGHNEAGKSLMLEMVRWLLFGSDALRGVAADYKKLRGELVFAPRGELYRVQRTASKAVLFRGDEEVAVGTRAVNEKIVSILGYGLAVFDIANAANQGDLDKLGAIRPAERKRLVDSVIGLGVIEDLAKMAGEEANQLARRADDLMASVREPEEPVIPDGYVPSEQILPDLMELRQLKTRFDQLEGILSRPARAEPQRPETKIEIPASELKGMVDRQGEAKARLRELRNSLATLPKASPYSDQQLSEIEAQLADYDSYTAAQAYLTKFGKTPLYSNMDLSLAEAHCEDYVRHTQREDLIKQINRLKAHDEHTCPNCDHHWYGGQDEIDSLQSRLNQLPEVPVEHQQFPSISPPMIAAYRKENEEYIARLPEIAKAEGVPKVDKPILTQSECAAFKVANAKAASRDELEKQIASLERQLEREPDFHAMWMERQRYELAVEAYARDWQTWIEDQQARANASLERDSLAGRVGNLSSVERFYNEALMYEHQMTSYRYNREAYDLTLSRIASFRSQEDDWRKARTALGNLRGMVKQHLIPSLNKVASYLLFQMTGGSRQRIEVDDDFNIMVDDQALDTLSGSGKAVANLSLRLGLGQVLTNNVLSVFIGDEIDGSMDKDRAENTSRTLQNLKKSISQILLITHKYPEADYYISLGNNNENQLASG